LVPACLPSIFLSDSILNSSCNCSSHSSDRRPSSTSLEQHLYGNYFYAAEKQLNKKVSSLAIATAGLSSFTIHLLSVTTATHCAFSPSANITQLEKRSPKPTSRASIINLGNT
jgi:hypothetical protein